MFTCRRCGTRVPRLTLDQERCVPCGSEVAQIIAIDEKRRTRFQNAKALEGWRPAA